MAIVTVGPMVIPPPDGVDMSDMDRFAENLTRLKPANFIAPWLAHALGTLVGAFVAAKLAASHKMKLALGTAVVFLLGGIMMVSNVWWAYMVRGPRPDRGLFADGFHRWQAGRRKQTTIAMTCPAHVQAAESIGLTRL